MKYRIKQSSAVISLDVSARQCLQTLSGLFIGSQHTAHCKKHTSDCSPQLTVDSCDCSFQLTLDSCDCSLQLTVDSCDCSLHLTVVPGHCVGGELSLDSLEEILVAHLGHFKFIQCKGRGQLKILVGFTTKA